jgi:NADPH2:quinone reductase
MTTKQTTEAIQIHEYGGLDKMLYASIDVPSPAAGEVQIRQHAIGVNFLDTYHRKGVFSLPELPGAPGVEGAGEVVAVGEGVTRFQIGQRVAYPRSPIGAYVGLRNVAERHLVHIPDGISYEVAAAAILQGATAHMLINRVAPLQAGQTVLVHAAAGGLGSFICQWASSLGVRVIGSVGSREKAERAYSLGCESVILYKEESFVDGVNRLTDGQGVDVVYEGLGGKVFHQSLECLKPFGHLINLGQVAEGLPQVNIADLGPMRSLTVSVPGLTPYLNAHPNIQAITDELFDRILSGQLKVHIGGRFALRDAAEAHRALESGSTQGSLILLPEGV